MTVPRVGLLGFGEVARSVGAGLAKQGASVSAHVSSPRNRPPYSRELLNAGRRLGIRLVDSPVELAANVDVILSAVTPASAPGAGESVLPSLHPGQLYADLNSCHPDVKRQLAGLVEQRQARFADVAITTRAAVHGVGITVLVSGSGAERFARDFEPFGMRVEVVGDEAGLASGLKMLRSVCTKGQAALLWEMVAAALALGIDLERWGDTLWPVEMTERNGTFAKAFDRFVTNAIEHVGRRAEELADIARLLSEAGIQPVMSKAALERFTELAASEPRGDPLAVIRDNLVKQA